MALVLCTALLVWFLAKKTIVINTAIKDGKELSHLIRANISYFVYIRFLRHSFLLDIDMARPNNVDQT